MSGRIDELLAELEDHATPERLDGNLAAVNRRLERPRRPRSLLLVAASLAVVALVVGLVWTRSARTNGGVLELASGGAPTFAPRVTTALSDDSRVHLGAGDLSVLESSSDRFELLLSYGWARFDVRPGGPRRWRIDAGSTTVEVVGTSFTVLRRRTSTRVDVHRGAVLVRTPEGTTRLERGEHIVVDTRPLETHVASFSRPARGTDGQEAPAPVQDAPPRVEPEEHVAAPEGAAQPEDLDALLDEADRARAIGDTEHAAELLRRAVRHRPVDARVQLAAFTLGRLELEQCGRPAAGERALALALELGIGEPWAEDAAALRVRALANAGRLEEAERAAQAYEASHPAGRWRAAIARWVGEARE